LLKKKITNKNTHSSSILSILLLIISVNFSSFLMSCQKHVNKVLLYISYNKLFLAHTQIHTVFGKRESKINRVEFYGINHELPRITTNHASPRIIIVLITLFIPKNKIDTKVKIKRGAHHLLRSPKKLHSRLETIQNILST